MNKIITSIAILFCINLLMVSSIAPQLFYKQLLIWIIAVIAFIFAQRFNLKQLIPYKWTIFILCIALLSTPLILNEFTRGSRRWINIGNISIQPSEYIKPGLMIFLSDNQLPLLHLIPVFLILLQPDLGSAISVLCLMTPIVLYDKKIFKLFIISAISLIILSPIIWKFGLKAYQQQRVLTFLNPAADPLNTGYNVIQSKIAIGSGGLFGKGYKKGTQGQLLFLPEKHTDFIFAATAEELGIIGVSIIIFAYYTLISTMFKKAYSTHDKALFIFILGIGIQLWMQIFVNIGMNLGLLPVTGIPLPFISIGGSSTIAYLFALGICFSA
jgi:rod shape determining protein RodA